MDIIVLEQTFILVKTIWRRLQRNNILEDEELILFLIANTGNHLIIFWLCSALL